MALAVCGKAFQEQRSRQDNWLPLSSAGQAPVEYMQCRLDPGQTGDKLPMSPAALACFYTLLHLQQRQRKGTGETPKEGQATYTVRRPCLAMHLLAWHCDCSQKKRQACDKGTVKTALSCHGPCLISDFQTPPSAPHRQPKDATFP